MPEAKGTPLNDRQRQALEALRAAGGRQTVNSLVGQGLLPDDGPRDRFGRSGARIGWGRTLGALARRGLVDCVYQSDEPAGVSLVWWAL